MATVTDKPRDEQRLRLHNVSWQMYEALLEAFHASPSVRLTYDRGNLELMTPSRLHERFSWRIGRLIAELTRELGIEIDCGGSMTFRREDLERGLEPDKCFWVQHELLVRDKDELDFRHDPPPDLAVEVDISHSSRGRQEIYAALGVPELWRFDGQTLSVLRLQSDGQYMPSTQSGVFPFLPLAELLPFLLPPEGQGETSVVQEFVHWVQTRVAPLAAKQPPNDPAAKS